jgi:hypothetical protein
MERLSRSVNMFCGGSLIANRGLRLGSTRLANWFGGSKVAIRKMLGNMYGRRSASFICFQPISIAYASTVNTDLFQERWEDFPDAKSFREFTQDSC